MAEEQAPYSNKNDPSWQWNNIWNQGYNQSNVGNNPYAGQVYGGYDYGQAWTLGQQKYKENYAAQNTGSGAGSNPSPNTGVQDSVNAISESESRWMKLIEDDYNTALNQINIGQQDMEAQGANAMGAVDTAQYNQNNAIEREGVTQLTGVQSQVGTAQKSADTATREARDLYRQTQNQNVAQLSGLGISSSSVAEALAETLGVETARRIAGVTGSLNEVKQNAEKEIAGIKNYVAQRKTEVEKWVGDQKSAIQQQLITALREINNQRQVAANEKARARASAMDTVQTNLREIANVAQQWQQTLDIWAKGQSDKVWTSITDLQAANENLNTVTGQNYQPTDFILNPNNMTQGRVGGYQVTPQTNPYNYATQQEEWLKWETLNKQ